MASVDRRPLHLWFDHGLGDCTQFAQYLQLLRRRGYDIAVHFEENKGFLWRVAGIGYAPSEGAAHVGWTYRPDFNVPVATVDQSGNKVFGNFGRSPLPDLGDDKAVWDELCDTVELKARPFIGESALVDAKRLVEHLERPIVLLHSNGSNFQDAKDFPRTMLSELYRGLLDELECTLVLLDWDDRVPALRHGRVRHLRRDWGHLDLERLAAVMEESDLLIGVDSGPFHFASLSSIPSLGVFYGHYPSCVALPRSRAAMMTRNGEGYRDVNIKRRRRWNIVGNWLVVAADARHVSG